MSTSDGATIHVHNHTEIPNKLKYIFLDGKHVTKKVKT